jgi:hypothetical protein
MRRYWQVMRLGQPNTAINKYSRAPIGNRVGPLFYRKERYRSLFSSSKRTSYCQQELDSLWHRGAA